jgi:hypothetical protein
MTVMMGIGLMAAPMAWVRIELMALPIVSFLRTPPSYALDAEGVSF